MSVGLSIRGKVSPAVAASIVAVVVEAAKDHFGIFGGGELLGTQPGEKADASELVVSLHPGAEPANITLYKSMITIVIETGTMGAGYHAAVVDWLDEVGRRGVSWRPDDDEFFDCTSYRTNRDFDALALGMLIHAQNELIAIAEKAETGTAAASDERFSLWMPIEPQYGHGADDLLNTPMGPRSREWVQLAASDTGTEGLAGSAGGPAISGELFIWQHRGIDAVVMRNTAVALMWLDVPWCEPTTDATREMYGNICTLLAKAHELDPKLDLPWYEWNEITDLSEEADPLPPSLRARARPRPARPIGYRRGDITLRPLPQIVMQVPGSFVHDPSDEGYLLVGEGLMIRAAAWMLDENLTKDEALEFVQDMVGEEEDRHEVKVLETWAKDGVVASAYTCLTSYGKDEDEDDRAADERDAEDADDDDGDGDGDGEPDMYRIVQCSFIRRKRCARLTLMMDVDQDPAWAMKVCKSLRMFDDGTR